MSEERTFMRPSWKLDAEPPPKVKAAIRNMIKIPLEDIETTFSRFTWDYDKGNFHHWTELFLHFDEIFRKQVCSRKDLQLSDNYLNVDDPFPKGAVLQILRVMRIILENCQNKSSFNGLEHFTKLLASTDPDILIAALQALAAFVRINPSKLHVGGKLPGVTVLNHHLLSLSQGWGSNEEGLGLFSCVVDNGCDDLAYQLGSTLHFEFYANGNACFGENGESRQASGLQVIHIPELHFRSESDTVLLKQFVDQYQIPIELRFSLLTRIRYARAFHSLITRRQYVCIRLLAFMVLVQSNDVHEELMAFFANDPEFINEIIKVVQSEEIVPENIRTLAMLALASQLAAHSVSHERTRILNVSTINTGGNRLLLLNLLQKSILSVASHKESCSVSLVEALLYFFRAHVMSFSSSGSAIRETGLVPALLSLLQDTNSSHIYLVSFAVKTLKKFMDYSNPAVILFRDLGGFDDMIGRLQIEVSRIVEASEESKAAIGLEDQIPYCQRRLIKALLKALGSRTYAPVNSSRPQGLEETALPASLSLIFHHTKRFGGDIFYSAVTLMNDIIHKDPTCFSNLHTAGLPIAFLDAVTYGLLPSSKALRCIPGGLDALCLNNIGLQAVKDRNALQFLVEVFTSRKYLLALSECVGPLAYAMEELLRHVPSLRGPCVDVLVEILEKIASIGGTNFANLEGLDSPVPMDTDPEDKHNEGHDATVQATGLMVDGGSNEHFIQRCIFHVMALMHRAMENAETCRLFVEKKGIGVLIRFLTLSDIPQSYEGMSHFVHIVAVFKAFSQQYSAPLAQAFCCCLRQHLKITFSQLNPVAGTSLLVLENGKKRRVFQCLFVIQFFMFIADGLRENRWMTALLTEFGNDSKDVLHDIGRIHREILWQFALSEDSKSEIEKDSGGSSCGFPRNSDATASEVDDHSLTSVGQYVNPILRQHRQLSGWNGESQLFDLIRLFHDFGHRTRPPWMLNMDYSSRVRLGVGHQVQVPHAYQGTPASKTESNKQQSYNSFCFEILKSLSVHITHLFLELGKVMLLPSRRQDDSLTVVPVAKSVASTLASIILDDLAYDGQTDGPQMELRLTTKCRYMGKVIDFIEGIIVDRQESCNSVLVNFFYAHGVLKSILTTFEATCQLLWAVMQTPPTLMETEDSKPISDHNDENDNAWIFGTLGSCAWLMDHLVTLACNMAPFTTQLLVQPVSTGTILIPRDPEIYVKWVQSQVLKVVLPVWNHPSFLNCNVDFVGSICSIMMHAYSGVDIKLSKVTGGNGGAQLLGRLPDDSAIEVIVEMGFSRSRAVEALRQIGTSSIEMAMEWLFSHSEEVSEEDEELARALALSLGNMDVSAKDDKITNVKDTDKEEEKIQVPPVDEILSACIKLLKAKDSVAFPVRDLLVTICTDNEGQHRFSVISSIMEELELNKIRFDSDNSLSSLSHILALILHEDSIACEVAAAKGLASTALNILSNFDSRSVKAENLSVPKWVTATLLTLDCMLQVKPKFDFHPRTVGQSKRKEVGSGGNSVIVSEDNQHISLESASDMCAGFMTIEEKKRVIDIVCNLVQSHLPSTTAQAVLQLCARLTRVHAIAVHFLEAGGLVSLLRLPVSCLFSGFDSVAATIIRHILEDSQTLRQAMESEIRHNLVASLNRHTNGRVSPRSFLTNLAPVISRDPAVFMLAAQAVCQIEMVGGRPNVILSKEKDKDFEKHKYKEKDQITEKDRSASGDNKSARGETNPAGKSGNETYKMSDLNAKNVKVHNRPPQSFSSVIEHLLDAIIEFSPPAKEDDLTGRVASTSSVIDMDVDEIASEKKGKAVMDKLNLGTTDMPEALAVLVKVTFILKLMTEILLMYPASINVLLRYDTESSHYRGTPRGESSVVGHGGLLYHVLHGLLPYPGDLRKEKKIDGDWRHKLSKKASQFLMAICVRAAEGRRRLFAEITNALNSFVDSSDANGFRPTEYKMCAFIDLINDVLAARSPLGSNILAEVAMTLIDVGMVQALTRTLQILDLDHPDSPKVVNGIVKALESLTREQVHGHGKDGAPRDSGSNQDQAQSEGTHHEGSPNSETIIEPLRCEIVSGRLGSFHNGQVSGGFDAVTDDMEQDRDTISCGFVLEAEEAFMHEVSEEVGGLEDGGTPSAMTFNVQHGAQNSLTDEDEEEDLSEDGRENEEGEEEDEDYLDEDEVHFSHPDTDMDDRDDLDFDEDDLDEDLEEEEEEEDEEDEEEEEEEEDENRLILRLEDDINVLDQFEVLHGADGHYPNDPFHVMPVEVFGSTRRQGRTTSIYNLLGRTDDSRTAFQHPLLTGPPAALQSIGQRVTEASDRVFAERNLESILIPSLDSIFQTLRSGRPGNRLSSWADDNQQHRGANGATIAQAIEELFISQLQTPVSNQPSDLALNDIQSRAKVEANVLRVPEQGVGIEASLVNVGNDISETMECVPSHNKQPSDSSTSAVATDASEQDTVKERQTAIASDHGLNMQCECNDHGMLIAEAVSQDSSGSGATLGESHRSLEVEIGSADGHDDRGERQNSIQRLPVRDIGLSRIPVLQRGPGMMGNHGQTDNSDPVQQNVNAVAEDVNQTACSGGLDEHQQNNTTRGSSSIDPTFLEALPEELRAEVLASQHNQVEQTANGQPLHSADIDPEFLAALPPDIQAEVLAQQRAQRLHQSQEFEGQPVEMDSASIIATFPSDLREEVLLTSSDAVLANLTPALVAEANMLRERFAHRYHSRTLLGVFHRNRRNDSGNGVRTISSGFERVVGNVGICKSAVGGKLIEADGMPLVDTAALKALIQLLSLVQPLYKGPLQRLLLNLCAHSVTRATLVHILLNLLMPNAKKFCGNCSSCVQVSSYRLYGCQGHMIYSRPQFSDGVPPLVSRRVLETLTYLARNDPRVANLLLYFDMSVPHLPERLALDFGRGKAVMIDEECQLELSKERSKEGISIMLLLNLLTQPLYSRSTVHLEQVMNLLDVIMANAEIDSKSWTESQVLGSGLATATDGIMQEAELGNDISGSGSNVVSQTSAKGAELSNSEEDSKPSTSGTENKVDAATVLLGLPKKKLRLLCSLLARDGLSDNAYSHVVEVLKKLVIVAPLHCHLFITELADAAQRLSRSALSELQRYGDAEIMILSTTSIAGAAILRVLQALSSLAALFDDKEKDDKILSEQEHEDVMDLFLDLNTALEPLWQELSICIGKMESCSSAASILSTQSGVPVSGAAGIMSSLPPGTQNILPYIEAFFVTHEKLQSDQSTSGQQELNSATACEVKEAARLSGSTSLLSSSVHQRKVDEKGITFMKFAERHRRLLNCFICQNPGLLEKSLSLMLKLPRLIDFDNKRAYFRSRIRHRHDHHPSPLRLSVRRAYILEDSYNQLRLRSTSDLKGRLAVHFQREEGIDAGGLTREWYQLLSRVIFDKGALLFTTVGNESTFQPNPNSVYQTEHLSYFKFVGRVVAKALFDGQLLDVHFTRSFYKHILGVKVTYHDIEAIDPDFFKNLKWMLENDIGEVLDLTFSMDADEEKLILYERAEVTDYELIPGGRNLRVSEENKHEYVDLVAEHRLTTAIRPQINAFLEGFCDLIPKDLISIFNDKELELLISGLPEIDLDDLRANTEYAGYSAASSVIQWFWEVVQSFSKEEMARLLQFVTGTSKVPLEGFKALQGISGPQRFQIHKAYGSPDRLPSAHTCFNQLDLPEYPSKQQLQERLLLAIHEASEGFGFG